MARVAIYASLLSLVSLVGFAQTSAPPSARQILEAHQLWGKDFDVLRGEFENLQVVGPRLEVKPDKILGGRELSAHQGALAALKLNKVFHAGHTAMMVAQPVSGANATWTGTSPSSQTSRVAITRTEKDKPQFLAPDLTAGVVLNTIGSPESVDHQTVSVGVEGRPEVVTVYSYAGGAIQFQTSNYSPRLPATGERIIESVVIDTSKLPPTQQD